MSYDILHDKITTLRNELDYKDRILLNHKITLADKQREIDKLKSELNYYKSINITIKFLITLLAFASVTMIAFIILIIKGV